MIPAERRKHRALEAEPLDHDGAPDAPDGERAGVGGREECEGAPAVRVAAAA